MSYIKKLVVDNFQSHEHTEVEFGPGLNVIVGPSDHGKSALVRALRWLFYNEPRGTGFIRVGSQLCRVRVVMDDGTVVTRLRTTSGKNQYLLQRPGEEEMVFEGFGSEVPAEVIKATGVRKILVDEHSKAELNLGGQLDGPFLLAENGAVRAKVIGQLGGVHLLDWAQRSVNTELRRLRDEENRIGERLKSLAEALRAYEHLPELQDRIERCADLLRQAEEKGRAIDELIGLRREWEVNSAALAETERILSELAGCEEAEERVRYLEGIGRKYREMTALLQEMRLVETRLNDAEAVITGSGRVPAAEDLLVKVADLYKEWSELSRTASELARVTALLNRIALIAGRTGELGVGEARLSEAEGVLRTLTSCSEVLREWHEHEKAYRGVCLAAERYQKEMEQHLKAFRDLLMELGRCPVCLGELNREAIKRVLAEYR
ncbi:MAG: hypothetical protein PWQ99_213 [Clostridia bacterium]|jgi:DNA repair exonuclease SbcCD ATPase subunit|uniref:Nuclease SbcCD subunit C n=1 Tax=Thermacetogenium phaeum TaxID=85874 RepID=A0A117LB62_9THEO|nr:MAG: Uncharacterized protein XD66_0847 [Thermacetogenium phaeum]MDK2880438.1 hypothetical protein [Clostridia bacterium]MDN5365014.1 hypothetical protein [Thermacetogenium sp.]MDN5375211.1 hypothetical protein [Thermacetogenium sp.]